jgi:hypothetical protein
VKLPKKGNVINCKTLERDNSIIPKQNPKSDHIKPGQDLYRKKDSGESMQDIKAKDHAKTQINTLRIIIEQSMEYVANLYLLFVDIEKSI